MAFGINEYRRAFSKRLFLKTLQRLVPLTMDDIRPGRSGVRALLLNQDGDTRDDFRIEATDRSIHILNAPLQPPRPLSRLATTWPTAFRSDSLEFGREFGARKATPRGGFLV